MFFFTGCDGRNAKSSRRSARREKVLFTAGDANKRQSTIELCGTSGLDSSASFSILLNYSPHSPTVFRQVLTLSNLPKTTSMVRKITFSLFKEVCVYLFARISLAAKGYQDVISNELLYWFI